MEIALDFVEPRLGKIVPALGFPPRRARRAAFRERFQPRAARLVPIRHKSEIAGHNLGSLFEGAVERMRD